MNRMAWKKGMKTATAIMLAVGIFFGSSDGTVTAFAANAGASNANESSQAASSNANLKSLNVTPGNMSPEFSPEITEYTVNIDEDVTSVSVTCSTASSTAKVVQAGGFKDLQPGSNEGKLTVQAEDGTQCTYTLHIIRGGATAASDPSDSPAPSGQSNRTVVTSAGAAVLESAHSRPSGTVAGNVPTPGNAGVEAIGQGTEGETESEVQPTEGEEQEGEDPGDAPTEEPSSVISTDLIPVGGETIYAPFYVNPTFPDELIPQDFVRQDYNYKGTTVSSAYFPIGNIRLLYLSAADGGGAAFRIYYEDEDTFMDFVQFKGMDGKFIMPVRNMGKIKIPDNYTGSYLPWTDTVVACFVYTELTDRPITYQTDEPKDEEEQPTEDEEPVRVEDLDAEVEFFLIYAMNQNGEENFYLYDIKEDTYQRYVERDTSYELDQSYFKYKDIAHQRFAVICILILLLVLALFAIFNMWMKNRELKEELFEEDEDEKEEEGPKKPVVKKESKEKPETKQETKQAAKPVTKQEIKQAAKPVTKQETKQVSKPVTKQETKQTEKPAAKPAEESEMKAKSQSTKKEPVQEEIKVPEKKAGEKAPGLKMINLSRESETSGIDDDFEFEFINLEDE
ncbi:MAG: cadherin-like beta sandwich domain-containing protein [Lachnospiraceae bacterium]|nr:cadherin-like beta sandwich domain-containing protein [Lachnospiraceae bacterium]